MVYTPPVVLQTGDRRFDPIQGVPYGVPLPYFGSAAPDGYEFVYGQVAKKHLQPKLFNAIGTQYNTGGEGSDEFRWPDMRGLSFVGLDNMGGSDAGRHSTANTLGLIVGSQTVLLTSAQSGLKSHDHLFGFNNVDRATGGTATEETDSYPGADGNHLTAGSGAEDADEAHDNMPPSIFGNWIMRAA